MLLPTPLLLNRRELLEGPLLEKRKEEERVRLLWREEKSIEEKKEPELLNEEELNRALVLALSEAD